MSDNFNGWQYSLKRSKNKVGIEKLLIFFFCVFFVSLFPCQLFADKFEFRQPSHQSKKPFIGKTYSNDRDGNGLEDQLEAKLEKATRKVDKAASIKDKKKAEEQLDDKIDVELIFTSPIKENQLKNFERLGGEVGYRYKAVSYGWNGRIPLRKLKSISASMGTDLVLIQESKPIEAHLDTATSNGRVRTVWSSGFAGSATGFKGTDDITIGIVDSGVDTDHSDLYGRCVYWHDFSSENSAVPIDKYHHGSHVAGIAAGAGVSGGSGTGTLYYTDRSIPFLTFSDNGYFQPNLIHLPDAQVVFTSTAKWFGGAPTSLYLLAKPKGVDPPTFVNNAGWTVIAGPVTGYSPLTQSCTFTASSDMLYTTALAANFVDTSHVVGRFVIANSVENYPGAGDGFNKMNGVAPGCNLAASKVFTSTGSGYTSWLEAAVDDMVANRVEKNIKVMNLSIGIVGDPGLSPSLRQKINTAVSYGIVVVISAGNDGRESTEAERFVDDPGRAAWAITVAASNDENQLTDYTSQGFTDPNTLIIGQEEDYKPDVMAPGGSIYHSYIMSVDSGSGDGGSFLDQQPDDYTQMRGTSMASPFVAGSAALVIDALEQKGIVWDFNSLDDPSLVKMILCATSSETNTQRENGLYNPTLERASDGPNGFPPGKDNSEGYGLINVDAAVEAVTQQYSLGSTVNDTLLAGPYDKRVWARGVYIPAGLSFEPSLIVPDEGDFDLYLYSSQPGLYGKPIIVESSTNAGFGTNESLSFLPETDFNGFLVVKRIAGEGEFSLTTLIPSQQTLTLSSTVGGTITQPGLGVFQYSYGTDVEIEALADPGYSFTEWSGTGVDAGKVQDPNLASTTIRVDSDYTAVANFAMNQYIVTALAGDNGALDPVGEISKAYGGDQLFTAVPDTGYDVDTWSVDGTEVQTGGTTYTLSGITADHTVMVSFKPQSVIVTAWAGANGSVDPNGIVTAAYGTDLTFTATPDVGYDVDMWSVDGSPVQTSGLTYTLSNITADHTVAVSFKLQPLAVTVTVSADANGSVDPNGVVTAAYGADQLFTATPDTGYDVDAWLLDGSPVQTGGLTYTLSDITADHTVAVSFKSLSVTITASAGANGSVDPNGVVTAAYGTDQLFTAVPDTDYMVDTWLLDGSPVQTGGTSYTLSNITADHTVSVTFIAAAYTVTASAGANGSVDPNGVVSAAYGEDVLLTATPDTGYVVDAWFVDGLEVQSGGTSYTLTGITADHAVNVTFAPGTYTITASAGANGSVDPNGVVTASYGADQLFTAVPDAGYDVDNWLLDGSPVQTGGTTYTLSDITADHTIAVSFKPLSFTITASAGANGSVDPNGVVTAAYGADQLFTAVPDTGYDVDAWLVDGVEVQTGGTTYTLSDITADHMVSVSFKPLSVTITASAGANGSVDPNGIVTPAYGTDLLLTATPDARYVVDAWFVDGLEVQSGGTSYTLTDITADHAVNVTFAPGTYTITASAGANGSVDPNGVVTAAYGEDVLMTATPDSGYDVDTWSLDGSPVQTGGLTFTLSNITSDHTVSVTFIAAAYTVTVSAGANGSVDPNGVITAGYGDDLTFTATPDTDYVVDTWLLDGASVQTGGTTYTLFNITADHTVTVSFKPLSFRITVSAGANGSVDPNGVVTAAYGADQLFTATPDTGYDVDAWLLDGSPVQTGGLTYTLSNITTDHTVMVSFKPLSVIVTAWAGTNGSVDPNGIVTPAYGTDLMFTATPDAGYGVDVWLVDGTEAQTGGTTYTLLNVTAEHTVMVSFKPLDVMITVSAGANGSVDPNGVVSAAYGEDVLLTATPDSGYAVDAWTVDGADVQIGGTTYTLSNITADHTVAVSFKLLAVTITASAGANGSVDPNGVVSASYGADQLFTAVPDSGYDVDAWMVDGAEVQTGGTSYTLFNITTDHTVTVSFRPQSVIVTAWAGANGTVDPNGILTPDYGTDLLLTATPDAGYEVDAWLVDGSPVQTGGLKYTLSNVTADHTVMVSFKLQPSTYTITVSSGANGSVDPNGIVTPAYGDDLLLTATPDPGYAVDTWSVDGMDVQTGGLTYTLSDITADHTVIVSFKPLAITVTVWAGANGSVDPNGVVIAAYGADQLFTAVPDAGYTVDTWSVDGTQVQEGGTTYTLSDITADHTVTVTFKPEIISVTVSAGANGSVDPNGVVTVAYSADQLFTAVPDTGYTVDRWLMDGMDVQTGGTTYTLFNVTTDHTVTVTFKPLSVTITASAGANGTIDPNGVVAAAYGADQFFTAAPDTGYAVDTWSVDGAEVQTGGLTYTLSDITADHTVAVSFKLQIITVTASAGANGSVDPNGIVTPAYGADLLLTATPDTGYAVDTWSVDGTEVQTGGTTYTLSDITADHTVAVSFKLQIITVTASAGANGSVDPNGVVAAAYGTEVLLTATPDTGYEVDTWSVDGTPVQTGDLTYTLSDITADHTVTVTFIAATYTVTVSAGANGSVDPNGIITSAYGDDLTFTATPDTDYVVDTWTLDGSPVQTDGLTYTLSNITTDHMVSVSFKPQSVIVTASAGANGTVDPNGVLTVAYGTDQLFTAVPDTGYEVGSWSLDGTEVQTGGTTYTLSDITADHTVMVSFKPLSVTVTVSAGANGTVDPNGVVSAAYGTDQLFTATPDTGYEVDTWSVDGTPVQTGGLTYTLSDITADHTVTVSFKPQSVTVTVSAGANGSVDPNGVVTATYGADQLFTAVPDSGYEVDSWSLDGIPVQMGGITYTLLNVTADHRVMVTFATLTPTISGYCIEPDGITPVEGVLVHTDSDVNSITDANGFYTLQVDYGWTGIVTPEKEGYIFDPNNDEFINVIQNYTNVNYIASLITYRIAGNIFEQDLITPISDVYVTAENDGGSWITKYGGGGGITDENGYYELDVDYNWSGLVTPSKYAYAFDPNSRAYTNVLADQKDQGYTGEPMTFAISGQILNDCGVPIQGVTVNANNGGNQTVTDADGFYEVWVSYNWSGSVIPNKGYYTFDPNEVNYADVLNDQTNQNYRAFNKYDLDCDGSIGRGDLGIMADNWLDGTPGNICDFNKDMNVNYEDFTELAKAWLMK